MQLRNQFRQTMGKVATHSPLAIRWLLRQCLLNKAVEWLDVLDAGGDQVIFKNETRPPLFAEREGFDGWYVGSCGFFDAQKFATSLGRLNPLADHGTRVRGTMVLDIDRAIAKLYAVDGAVWTILHDGRLAAREPLLETQAGGIKQKVSDVRTDAPGDVAKPEMDQTGHAANAGCRTGVLRTI